ncbi:MAG: DUF2332 domain-containing protein [Solirubrobacteraceae bacterium]
MPAAADSPLSAQFRAHAQALVRVGRTPLYVALMTGAADDIDSGGVISRLFSGLPTPPGSVPQLRLLAALHELVLAGHAPRLTRFYPSVGGADPPGGAWPVARETLQKHFAWIRERLPRTVQTNEPGRSAVLYAVLLWLADRHRRPIRLLEIGASAGLNLQADRFAYTVAAQTFGDPSSALRFEQPWRPPPEIDLAAAQRELLIADRAGCDLAPLDPASADDRRRLLSYIWPDEPERLRRLADALQVAAADPVPVAAATASRWLPAELERRRPAELTLVWHSVMRQYVADEEWSAIQVQLRAAGDDADRPVVRVGMEPQVDPTIRFLVTLYTDPDNPGRQLARCGDHGPPVIWHPRAGG